MFIFGLTYLDRFTVNHTLCIFKSANVRLVKCPDTPDIEQSLLVPTANTQNNRMMAEHTFQHTLVIRKFSGFTEPQVQ